MRSTLRFIIFALMASFSLMGCDESRSLSSSDAGSLTGDGGKNSAQFAGRYQGNLTLSLKGDGVNENDVLPTTIVINNNGTISMTVEDETISGVINGNKLEVAIKLSQTEDGLKCNAEFTVNGTVSGTIIAGPAAGSAKCKLLIESRSATLSGSLAAKKV